MKKKVITVLSAIMALQLAACGSTSGAETTKNADNSAAGSSVSDVAESSNKAETASTAGKTTIEVWSSGEELGRFVADFNKLHPEITVNITQVPNSDFLAKLTPTLQDGQGAPDIFTGESDYVKYLVESGYWDDLSKAPYNADTSDTWDYVKSVGTDTSGTLRALSWQASPGSIFYRRDIAKKVLGTDDPDEVGKMLNSDSAMMDVAAKMKASGIKMFASWQDIMNMEFSNRAKPWVVDSKLVIDDSMINYMDMAKDITTKGYDLNVDPWAPEWSAAVENDDTFCYVLPSWGYQAVIKPAAKKTAGQWAMCAGPVPYVKGGTWLGIYKDSKNKEAAWEFMKFCCLDGDAQKAYAQQYGEYVSLKSVDAELAKGDGEAILGGQNPFAFYNQQMEKKPNDLITAYDGQINTVFISAAKAYATGKMSKDDAIKQFKSDVTTAYPDISTD